MRELRTICAQSSLLHQPSPMNPTSTTKLLWLVLDSNRRSAFPQYGNISLALLQSCRPETATRQLLRKERLRDVCRVPDYYQWSSAGFSSIANSTFELSTSGSTVCRGCPELLGPRQCNAIIMPRILATGPPSWYRPLWASLDYFGPRSVR